MGWNPIGQMSNFQKDLQKIRIGIVLKDLALVRKLSLQLINKVSNKDSIKVVCN